MNEYTLTSINDIDTKLGEQFLKSVYSPLKSQFLIEHGTWWHGGEGNQWVVTGDGRVIAYCGVIPTFCYIDRDKLPAIWWVDLIVAREYRGRGIQSIIDEKIRAITDLKLGFPNQLAAKIHQRHGWGVREEGAVFLLPLNPRQVKGVKSSHGWGGKLLKLGALGMTPWFAWYSRYYHNYMPLTARIEENPSPLQLAQIFIRNHDPEIVTTYRDEDYMQRRFWHAKKWQTLKIYVAGPKASPSLGLVVRYVHFKGVPAVRLLDMFGDLSDTTAINDVISLAIRDSVRWGASQVTIMNTLPELNGTLHRLGFVVKVKSRFCWHSQNLSLMADLRRPHHWTLADSDNDAPE